VSCWKYSRHAISLLVFLPVVLSGQRVQENVVPLKTGRLRCTGNRTRRRKKPPGRPRRSSSFRRCRVHHSAYVHCDHALPLGGYSGRRV